jgi:hypothetical protein
MGFMLIDAPAGEREIRLVFELPFENAAGRVVTGLSVLAVLALAFAGLRRGRASAQPPEVARA